MRFIRGYTHEILVNIHENGEMHLKGNRIRHCKNCKNQNSILAIYTPKYSPRKHVTTDEYGSTKLVEYNHGHTDINAFLICKECAKISYRNREVHEQLANAGAYIVISKDYEKMDSVFDTTRARCIYAEYYHPDYNPDDRSKEPFVTRLFLRKTREPLGYFCPICWGGTIYIKPDPSQDIKWQNGISVYRTKPLQREGSVNWPEFDALRFYSDLKGL